MNSKDLPLFLVIILLLLFAVSHVEATTMSNDQYILHMDNLNTNSNPTLDTAVVDPVVTSPTPSPQLPTYTIQINQNKDQVPSLGIGLSQDFIDFGILSPTNPITRTSRIHILNPNNLNYSLFAFEDHPLKATTSAMIPNTTCDNGACSQVLSAVWTSPLTYGFGYHCNEKSCLPEFPDQNSFKQFSDSNNLQAPQTITHGKDLEKNIEITYKINTGQGQSLEIYKNNIIYILSPDF